MTIPPGLLDQTTASTPGISLPDAPAVAPVIPGDLYVIRTERGHREAVITQYDLTHANIVGNEVSPVWSDPRLVIDAYGLGQVMDTSESILHALFGNAATIRPDIERDPDSSLPSLVFYLVVPRTMRNLRHDFIERFAREVVIPDGAPVPALLWEYVDAIPA